MTETHDPAPVGRSIDVDPASEVSPPRPPRLRALDGLRGIAMILVILSHGWIVWPTSGLAHMGPFANVFASGNLAVTIFFVVGGYLLGKGLLGQLTDTGEVRVWSTLLRRVLRIEVLVLTLVVVMLVVAQIPDARYKDVQHGTQGTALALATFTWNWHVLNDPIQSRPDMGHMWFVSVYVQVLVLLVLLFAILGRRRSALIATLAGAVVIVSFWRHQALLTEGATSALLRTTTRMDGMLWGSLLACIQPYVRVSRATARAAAATAVAALAVLILVIPDAETYLSLPGVLVAVAVCLFIVGTWHSEPGYTARLVGGRATAAVGRRSLTIFMWHYPVLWWVSRHGPAWHWATRLAVAAAATLAIVYVTERFIERPVLKWLDEARWTRTRRLSAAEGG